MKTSKTRLKIFATVFVMANLFFANAAFGQVTSITDKTDLSQSKTSIPAEEFKEGKYLVKIITNDDGSYGYEVYESKKIILNQKYKPFFTIPEGFKTKNNALIVGRWNALELLKDENIKKVFLPVNIAKELGVTQEDLILPTVKNK